MYTCPICKCNNGTEYSVPWDYGNVSKFQELNRKFTYIKCERCGCVYLDEMKNWTPEQFSKYIYNSDYAKMDSGYNGDRAKKLFSYIYFTLSFYHFNSILDYGGGKGHLVDLLKFSGFKAYCYDEFDRKDIDISKQEKFDICTAIEVLEHEFNADKLWNKFKSFVKVGGMLICSTDYSDGKDISSWYYAHPKAGHVLLYSGNGIMFQAKKFGFKYIGDFNAFNILCHVFQKVSE